MIVSRTVCFYKEAGSDFVSIKVEHFFLDLMLISEDKGSKSRYIPVQLTCAYVKLAFD